MNGGQKKKKVGVFVSLSRCSLRVNSACGAAVSAFPKTILARFSFGAQFYYIRVNVIGPYLIP